jgi:peptidoglycan/LPS O-acetylase OafA/YrhL
MQSETVVQRGSYWPALDGFRGATIWAAISVHAGYLTANGTLSLDTFFVLSGFLITGLLLREYGKTERIDLGAFWARRARRLLPGLFLMLAAVGLYALFIADRVGLDSLRADIVSSLTYVTNWRFIASGQSYFAQFGTPSPILHLWSLAVEEQFYLFWPIIVLGVLRWRNGSWKALAVVTGVGSVASAMWMAHLYQPGGDASRVYYGTDTRAQAMLIGALLAIVVHRFGVFKAPRAQRRMHVVGIVGAVLIALPWFIHDSWHDWLFGWSFGSYLYAIAAAVVLASLVQTDPGPLGSLLSLKPLRAIGAISYGMYLWHWPVYIVFDVQRTGLDGIPLYVFRLAIVVLFAAASYWLVEKPVRERRMLRKPKMAFVAVPVAGLAVFALVVIGTNDALPQFGGQSGDIANAAVPKPVKQASTDAPTGAIKTLVVGDSQGYTLADGPTQQTGVAGLSSLPDLAVWNRSIIGCAIERTGAIIINGAPADNRCGSEWPDQWREDVTLFQPAAVVVMAGAWDVFDRPVEGGRIEVTSPEYQQRFTADATLLLQTVGSTGAEVLVIKTPCFGENLVPGGTTTSPERLDQQRISVINRGWKQAARATGAHVLDLDPVLCPDGTADGEIRADGAHFSLDSATRVAAIIDQPLQELVAGKDLPRVITVNKAGRVRRTWNGPH